MTASTIAARARVSQPTVSHHMKILADAGLIRREQRGKWAYSRVIEQALIAVARGPHPRPALIGHPPGYCRARRADRSGSLPTSRAVSRARRSASSSRVSRWMLAMASSRCSLRALWSWRSLAWA